MKASLPNSLPTSHYISTHHPLKKKTKSKKPPKLTINFTPFVVHTWNPKTDGFLLRSPISSNPKHAPQFRGSPRQRKRGFSFMKWSRTSEDILIFFGVFFWSSHVFLFDTLPETNSSHLIRCWAPKGKDRLPTIRFRCELLVLGSVNQELWFRWCFLFNGVSFGFHFNFRKSNISWVEPRNTFQNTNIAPESSWLVGGFIGIPKLIFRVAEKKHLIDTLLIRSKKRFLRRCQYWNFKRLRCRRCLWAANGSSWGDAIWMAKNEEGWCETRKSYVNIRI